MKLQLRRGQEVSARRDIASSSVFARDPEGNGIDERFIRELKENLLWVGTSLMWRNGASV